MNITERLAFMQGYIQKEAMGSATEALIQSMAPGIHLSKGQPNSMHFKNQGYVVRQEDLPGMTFGSDVGESAHPYNKDMAKIAEENPAKVGKVMSEFKNKTLHSGSKKGPIVKDRKQAIAIAMSEADMDKKASILQELRSTSR